MIPFHNDLSSDVSFFLPTLCITVMVPRTYFGQLLGRERVTVFQTFISKCGIKYNPYNYSTASWATVAQAMSICRQKPSFSGAGTQSCWLNWNLMGSSCKHTLAPSPCLLAFFFFSFYHKILLLSIKVVSLQTRDNGCFLAQLFWAAPLGMSGLSLEGCPEATWRHSLLSVPTMVNLRAQPQVQREDRPQTRCDQPRCRSVAI